MMKSIFLAIQNHLITEEAIGIKTVDWYKGQEEPGSTKSFATPGVFIEFEPMSFTTESDGAQMSVAMIHLHLITGFANNDTRHKNTRQSESLDHLDFVDKIFVRLERHFATAGDKRIFDALQRTNLRTDHAPTTRFHSVMSFKTRVYDYGAEKISQLAPINTVNITVTK